MAVPQQSILALAAILTSCPGGEGGRKARLGPPLSGGVRGGPPAQPRGLFACLLLAAWEQPDSKSAVFFSSGWRCRRGSIRGQPPDGLHERFYTNEMGVMLETSHPWITSLHYASSTTACGKGRRVYIPLRLTTLSRAKDSEFEPWQPRLAVPMLLGGWWHAGCHVQVCCSDYLQLVSSSEAPGGQSGI